MKVSVARKPATKRRLPDLERDTPIVALAVARAVLESRSAKLDHPLPDSLARAHYRHSPVFRRRLRAPGDRGRDTLHAFMHHWLDEWFARHRARLPRPFHHRIKKPVAFLHGRLGAFHRRATHSATPSAGGSAG